MSDSTKGFLKAAKFLQPKAHQGFFCHICIDNRVFFFVKIRKCSTFFVKDLASQLFEYRGNKIQIIGYVRISIKCPHEAQNLKRFRHLVNKQPTYYYSKVRRFRFQKKHVSMYSSYFFCLCNKSNFPNRRTLCSRLTRFSLYAAFVSGKTKILLTRFSYIFLH